MALPGLSIGASAPIIEEEKPTTVHELRPNTEWRFEVAWEESIEVRLLAGTVEIFGTELAINQPYVFKGRKAAIFTWHGCRLEVQGRCQIDYVADETPMASYANAHFALDGLRDAAAEMGGLGPRVLIVGPENAGKTSLTRMLSAYAMRSGQQPVVVNLDPREGMFAVPGTLSAAVLESIADVELGWGSSPTNGPTQIPVKLPLVYYYGMEEPEDRRDIYKALVTRLAVAVANRMEDGVETKRTGCFIDTPGSMSQGKDNHDIIQHVVAEFSINVLIVLGSERLYSDMLRRFDQQFINSANGISVVKLDKSGGCVDRDAQHLQRQRQAQVREYFFGDAKNPLSPHTQTIDFDGVAIYRAVEHSVLMASLLPGGVDPDEAGTTELFERVEPSVSMQHCLLAIVQAGPNESQEALRDACAIGFVHVEEVDEKRRKIRLLAPVSGRLPRKAMVLGSWPEPTGNLVG